MNASPMIPAGVFAVETVAVPDGHMPDRMNQGALAVVVVNVRTSS